jgi:ADP-ribose pyrophosphatase YjhB (NUDIX family)
MQERIHTVGAVAFQEKKVVLVCHGEEAAHLTGVWGLPGGRLNEGEGLLAAAAREFEEETGLIPDVSSMVQLPTIYEGDIKRKSGEILRTYWNVFLVRDFTGDLVGTDETVPEWVPIEEVSRFENLLPNTENAIREGLTILKS